MTNPSKPVAALDAAKYDVFQSQIYFIQGQLFRASLNTDDSVEQAWSEAQSLALTEFAKRIDPTNSDDLDRALDILESFQVEAKKTAAALKARVVCGL